MTTVIAVTARIMIMTRVVLIVKMTLSVGKFLLYYCIMMGILIVLTLLIDTLAYMTGGNRKWGE
mgnify:FL=1